MSACNPNFFAIARIMLPRLICRYLAASFVYVFINEIIGDYERLGCE